jgi:hypothetical protein
VGKRALPAARRMRRMESLAITFLFTTGDNGV